MTNETPPRMAVTVEQCDREAAAALMPNHSRAFSAAEILSGRADHIPNVQAFARHRLDIAQFALDQRSDDPLPGNWNDACVHISEGLTRLAQSAATGGEVPKALLAQACVKFGHPANMATDLFVHRNIALAAIEQAMLAAAPKPTRPNDMARENEGVRPADVGLLQALTDQEIEKHGAMYSSMVRAGLLRDILAELYDHRAYRNAALSTPSNPPAPSDGVPREAVARLIYPDAWVDEKPYFAIVGYWDDLKGESLAKADAILALTNPAGEGGVRARAPYPVDERAFHVVRRNLCDGSPEIFVAQDRATLSGFPAPDRDHAYAMVKSLNAIVRHHVERALAALSANGGEAG